MFASRHLHRAGSALTVANFGSNFEKIIVDVEAGLVLVVVLVLVLVLGFVTCRCLGSQPQLIKEALHGIPAEAPLATVTTP